MTSIWGMPCPSLQRYPSPIAKLYRAEHRCFDFDLSVLQGCAVLRPNRWSEGERGNSVKIDSMMPASRARTRFLTRRTSY